MKHLARLIYVGAIIAVVLIALSVRLRAVRLLPIDYDEDDYLAAAQRYAQFMAEGDVRGIIDYEFNYEHPPLTKLTYGLAILPLPEVPLLPEKSPNLPPAGSLPQPHFRIARLVSAAAGTLEVLALATLSPLAGLFLGLNTWTIKYTSQIMLEPLPALMSMLTVLFYYRSGRRWNRWMVLSAIALGLTAASKYVYCIVGLAIIVDLGLALLEDRKSGAIQPTTRSLQSAAMSGLGWGLLAIAVFLVANPRLWSDPLGRLAQSVMYHGAYAQSAHVRQYNLPLWQPLVYLLGPVPWHPGVFVVAIDLIVSVFAGLGLSRLWRRRRVFALWLILGLGFLLIWPTKWPQYLLTITAPVCLAASEGLRQNLLEPLARAWQRRSSHIHAGGPPKVARVTRRDWGRAVPWLAPGLLVLVIIAGFPLIYQGAMALTDFNATSIRDGIEGGVWRAAWQGLTGQEQPVALAIFDRGARSKTVHYAGPALLGQLLLGGAPDVMAFNLLWTILSVALQAVLGIAAALMLHRANLRLRTVWRTLFILPWAIPEFVGALIWLRIFEPRYGWLTLAQNVPAGVSLPNWFENPTLTFLILLVAATWYGFPFIMLTASAGLRMMPKESFDAAAMDGAAGWKLFRYVTWPLLLPLVIPALIIRGIFAFNQFYLFYTMRVGPPTITFATASFYIFNPSGSFGGQFAVSAAINIFTVLVLIGLVLWLNHWTRGETTAGVTYA